MELLGGITVIKQTPIYKKCHLVLDSQCIKSSTCKYIIDLVDINLLANLHVHMQ